MRWFFIKIKCHRISKMTYDQILSAHHPFSGSGVAKSWKQKGRKAQCVVPQCDFSLDVARYSQRWVRPLRKPNWRLIAKWFPDKICLVWQTSWMRPIQQWWILLEKTVVIFAYRHSHMANYKELCKVQLLCKLVK